MSLSTQTNGPSADSFGIEQETMLSQPNRKIFKCGSETGGLSERDFMTVLRKYFGEML